jgi:hypothetical protein
MTEPNWRVWSCPNQFGISEAVDSLSVGGGGFSQFKKPRRTKASGLQDHGEEDAYSGGGEGAWENDPETEDSQ